jgi:O-succinylbenzoate synthase
MRSAVEVAAKILLPCPSKQGSWTMKIERVRLRTVRLRLRAPFRTSGGLTHERRILLAFVDFGGVEGVAECVAPEAPNYTSETLDTARLVLERHLAPAVLGVEFQGPEGLGALMERAVRGHEMARATLEMAAWDAHARIRGEPLARVLGGVKASVPAGVSIGIQDDIAALLDRIQGFLEDGYLRIKLKIAPGKDHDVLRAVRERFPDIALTVDANTAYGRADLDGLRAMDSFDLLMLEQPFPAGALLLHAELQDGLATDVCLDESVTGPDRCRDALGVQAGRVVNIKPGRVGGHGPSREIHDLCAAAGVPVWCGGMLESGIGRAHNVALASLPNMSLPNDTSASARYWERDVVLPPFELRPDGTVGVPTGPGIGVEIDHDFLRSIEDETVELR